MTGITNQESIITFDVKETLKYLGLLDKSKVKEKYWLGFTLFSCNSTFVAYLILKLSLYKMSSSAV